MPGLPANTLPKAERLCGKSRISALISKGRWGSTEHIKYCWHRSREEGPGQIVVSVSKKFFKRAVKRNLLKRRLREAYRTQKDLLAVSGVDLLLAWSGKEIADFETVRSEVATVLSRVSKAVSASGQLQSSASAAAPDQVQAPATDSGAAL